MSELRHEPISRRWVIIATERSRRPMDFDLTPTEMPSSGNCPFCYGNESKTPPEILALRGGTPPNTPGWSVRVVPNKFPALRAEEDVRRGEEGPLFRFMGGCGVHEVNIESPDHHLFLGQQPVQQIEWVLRTLQVRCYDLTR